MHACLILWQYVPEMGVCEGLYVPARHASDDLSMAKDRSSRSIGFNMVSFLEIFIMFLVAANCNPGDGKKKQLVRGGVRLLPLVLVVSTLVVRMRHIGTMGCAEGDTQCCANLGCPDELYTSRLPGCRASENQGDMGFVAISWSFRNSFCPVPGWYSVAPNRTYTTMQRNVAGNVLYNCGGLYGTPDVASCYRYGCSSVATPIPYYGVHMITFSVILFVAVSLLSPSGTAIQELHLL